MPTPYLVVEDDSYIGKFVCCLGVVVGDKAAEGSKARKSIGMRQCMLWRRTEMITSQSPENNMVYSIFCA